MAGQMLKSWWSDNALIYVGDTRISTDRPKPVKKKNLAPDERAAIELFYRYSYLKFHWS